jgi:hypothetical protein
MQKEREKNKGDIVQTVKDVATEALTSAAQAATVVVATRAAQGVTEFRQEAQEKPGRRAPTRRRSRRSEGKATAKASRSKSARKRPAAKKKSTKSTAKKTTNRGAKRASRKKRS